MYRGDGEILEEMLDKAERPLTILVLSMVYISIRLYKNKLLSCELRAAIER